jgi:hypothetical protein
LIPNDNKEIKVMGTKYVWGKCDSCNGSGGYYTDRGNRNVRSEMMGNKGSYKHNEGYWVSCTTCSGTGEEEKKVNTGCFLSTACIEFKGLADDCKELQILRKFRDEYVSSLINGTEKIFFYYKYSPEIVKKISASSSQEKTLEDLYEMVIKAINYIENDDYFSALVLYETNFLNLLIKFDIDTTNAHMDSITFTPNKRLWRQ